ncbi:MAG: flagellar hook basal-body protein [Planctomycetes bacterium]|nr:flagellar hook basal-body protein [Planctomycetota bacterium]
MVDALSFAASALRTAQTRQDVTANNLANLVTPAFRSQRVDAADLPGGGVSVAAIRARPDAGSPEITDRGLDLAIHGAGFFQVQTPQGTRYTRAGSFGLDAQGQLVDAGGNPVAPGIEAPPGTASVAVGGDGTVTAILSDGTTQAIGTLSLARFPNEGGLLREGGNLLAATPASGAAAVGAPGETGFGTIVSGFLEGANVDLAGEMVGQIVNRAFFLANLATIRTENEVLGELMDIVG